MLIVVALQKGAFPDLMATSGDYLRVWRVGDSETRLECLLNNASSFSPFRTNLLTTGSNKSLCNTTVRTSSGALQSASYDLFSC